MIEPAAFRPTAVLLRVAALALVLAIAVPAGARAQGEDAALYARLNASLVDDYAIPRYRALAEAAAAMDEAATALCAAPGEASLAAARDAFRPLVLAWARLQHLHFHPQEMGMRAHRLQFWPDRRDQTARRIARFLHDGDLSVLEPLRFTKSSAVLQGLPALERMIHDDDHTGRMLAGGEDGALRCALLGAITANVKDIADAILDEWLREGGFRESLLRPGETNFLFHNDREGALAFFTHFHTAIEYAAESKIADPLGNEEDGPDPHFAEWWRSGLSLPSLAAGLESAAAMWSGAPFGFRALAEARGADGDMIRRFDAAFAAVTEAVEAVPAPLSDAVADPVGREAMIRLRDRIRELRAIMRGELAPALDLAVGFNSADGD